MSGEQSISARVVPIPAATTGCGLVVKPGVEPTTPEIGGLWYDDALDTLAYFKKNGDGIYLPNANGVAGQVLTSNGDAVPTWQAGGSGTGFLYQSVKQNSSSSNVTTLQTLVSFDAFTAGLMNVIGRRLVIKGKGFFTTAIGEIPTIRFDVYMAAASRASITSAAVTASLTNSPLEYEFVFQTSVIGASGKLITTATMLMSLDGTTYTNYMVIPDTDTSAFDLTGVFGPAVTVTCGGTALTLVDIRTSCAQVS